ncbi:hypothetical protein EG68_05863 [Paragonimus skrjabini miyazakii]|uniref:General transcription factor IIF subunit 1 n=1 Tax=Paragonimus skrjabini miyazakii TaxID=59628 RepID=A0A8S9YIJ7_9TREM|nr:hypothetical protein EG68_05863 [Paragonimus skrjabini miyazakii]
MQVRVPNRRDKRFSVLRFHSADHPDLSSGLELFMQRENNLKQFRSVHNLSDTPERGAGSEFGREAKEEARLRKYGIIRESYRPDDQPWIMTVGKGKTGRRRFKGVREGSVSENVEYFVFCQCKDGNFDAYPVHTWYKMKPEINYRFLREDEAEVEYNRLNKTMNLFNVMIKRKLTDGEAGEDEIEGSTVNRELGKELRYLSVATENRSTTDKSSGITSGRATAELKTDGSRKSNRALKLTDLEELDSDSDVDEEAEDEAEDDQNMSSAEGTKAGSSRSKLGLVLDESAKLRVKANTAKTVAERARLLRKKQRDATIVSRMRRCVKKRKARKGPTAGSSSENDDPLDEAEDESEVDDHEGDEVDYMTNSSSDEEKLSLEDRERIYEETGVDEETGLKALLTDLSSEEENEQDEDVKAESDLDDTQDDANVARKLDGNATRLEGGGKTYDSSGNLVSDEVSQRIQQAKKKLHNRNEHDALSSSSSSSSSVDGESSSYSSSSSDSDLDPDEKAKKNSRKAILFQKLSETIGTTPGTSGDLGDSVNSVSGLKRRPTETGESLTASPSSVQPAGKKSRLDLPVSTTAAATPTSTSSAPCDTELMSTVRKYLMRKPITVTELLKKIRLRKLVGKNEDAQTALANEIDTARLDNRRVLVTGANSGIGLACCQELAKRGAEVHMVCRNLERGQKARVTVIKATGDPKAPVYLHQVDLSHSRKIFEFARTFEAEQGELDILPRVIVVSSGGMLLQQLNHSDPMLVGKRTHFNGAMVYAQNKRQQMVMTEMWAERYVDICFSCMHPGWVDTPAVALSMPSFYHYMRNRLRTPAQGADTVVWLALTPTIRSYPNGSFFQDRKLANTHLPLAYTHSSKEEKLHFMVLLAQLAEPFVS